MNRPHSRETCACAPDSRWLEPLSGPYYDIEEYLARGVKSRDGTLERTRGCALIPGLRGPEE